MTFYGYLPKTFKLFNKCILFKLKHFYLNKTCEILFFLSMFLITASAYYFIFVVYITIS